MFHTVEPTSERVRTFALAVEEAGPSCITGEALVAHVNAEKLVEERAKEERDKWIRWWTQSSTIVWDTDGDDKVLIRHCKSVTDMWKTFSRKGSVKRALKSSGLIDLDVSTPPTIDNLKHIVDILKVKRDASNQTFWGKVRSIMIGFVSNLDAHKQLFSIFPNESIYTSVLSGVVSSVAVACTKHEKICERFTRGLLTIGNDLDFINYSARSLDTPPIRKAIAAAYVEVFKFLCSAMAWLASKRQRFGASMQSEFSEQQVGRYLDEIKRLADQVTRELTRNTHDEVVSIGQFVRSHNTAAQQRSTSDRFRRKDDAEKKESFDIAAQTFTRIGNEIKHCLVAAEEQHDYEFVLRMRPRLSADAPGEFRSEHTEGPTKLQRLAAAEETVQCGEDSESDTADESSDSVDAGDSQGPLVHHYARKELEDLSQSLQAYMDGGVSQMLDVGEQNHMQSIPSEALDEIQEWLRKKESSFLWVEGLPAPYDLSSIALRVWAVTSSAMIPCICFFSQENFPKSNESDYEKAGLICLFYTLIKQLIHHLPSFIQSDQILNEDYFSQLDGSWESTTFALDAISHLITYSPSSLVIVFHGLEDIEGTSTRRLLKDLIGVLREQSTRTVVKVLFTTNGMSHVLGENTKVHEQVDTERMAQGSPGRLLRGSSSVRELEVERSAF